MTKYTLNTYGWSMEALAKSLTDEQVQSIRDKMDDEEFSELHEVRFDLDDFDIDIFDGDLFHTSKAMNNNTIRFEILDEKGNEVISFDGKETADLYETIEDFDEKYEPVNYVAIPEYTIPPTNVFLSIDENKGGIFTFTFESDTVPTPTDFTFSGGSIETEDGDWDFIETIFFKGQPLEVEDFLDNTGKASTSIIYTLDGDTIE